MKMGPFWRNQVRHIHLKKIMQDLWVEIAMKDKKYIINSE
jgi:hypothetical protein